MILRGTRPRALSWPALTALLVCGAAILPLRPTWGQDRQTTPTADTTPTGLTPAAGTLAVGQQAPRATDNKLSGPAASSDAGVTGFIVAPRDLDEAKDAVELMQAQLEAKKAELLESRALVEQSRRQFDRLSKLRAQGGVAEEEVEQLRTELAVREARLRAKEAQIKEAEIRLRQANRWLSRLQSGAHSPGSTGTGRLNAASSPQRVTVDDESSGVPTSGPGVGRTSSNTSTRSQVGSGGTTNKLLDNPTTPSGGEQRIRDLELKLDKLLKEVEGLRREIRRQQPGGASRGTDRSDPTEPATPRR